MRCFKLDCLYRNARLPDGVGGECDLFSYPPACRQYLTRETCQGVQLMLFDHCRIRIADAGSAKVDRIVSGGVGKIRFFGAFAPEGTLPPGAGMRLGRASAQDGAEGEIV